VFKSQACSEGNVLQQESSVKPEHRAAAYRQHLKEMKVAKHAALTQRRILDSRLKGLKSLADLSRPRSGWLRLVYAIVPEA